MLKRTASVIGFAGGVLRHHNGIAASLLSPAKTMALSVSQRRPA